MPILMKFLKFSKYNEENLILYTKSLLNLKEINFYVSRRYEIKIINSLSLSWKKCPFKILTWLVFYYYKNNMEYGYFWKASIKIKVKNDNMIDYFYSNFIWKLIYWEVTMLSFSEEKRRLWWKKQKEKNEKAHFACFSRL